MKISRRKKLFYCLAIVLSVIYLIGSMINPVDRFL